MSEKRFVCIDVGYGDDWYITDNGKKLSKMEIVDKLNEQQVTINKLQDENEQLRRDKNFLRNERRLQEKVIFTSFDEINKLNKENEKLKRDHRIMVEKLYIISKDYIKDVGDDDEC